MLVNEQTAESRHRIYRKMLAGSLWALALRWGMHGIGLVNVVVLARLLTPADFGIVAMATVLMGFIGGFAEMGTSMLLLRMREVTRADCDTAWTIVLLQGILVGFALFVTAPFAVKYFSEPRLYPVILVFALCAIIGATGNVGMTLVRKELDFAKDFRFGVYTKLATFFPTLGLALWWRDYWALVLGQVCGAFASVVISYRMHPYRPRLSLERARQFLVFSVAVVGANLARFLKAKVDVFIVGGNTNAALMGSYNIASDLATMATQEVVTPVWRGLFPSFAAIVHDHERFVAAYGHLLATMAIVCFPLGFGLWAVAEDLILVLLGNQWTAAVAPLKWLAICAVMLAMIEVLSGNILFVSGHERRSAALMWLHLAVLIPSVMLAGRLGNVETVAMAVTISAAIVLPVAAWMLVRSIGFPAGMIWRALWRPGLAVAVMAVILKVSWLPHEWPVSVRLAAEVLLGAVIYVFTLASLWLISGQPEGPERACLGAVRRALGGVARYAGS